MHTFINDWSPAQAQILGMQLAPGATIRSGDVYNSSDGKWREAGKLMASAQAVIQPGCKTVWVRPGVELSNEAEALLDYLVRDKGCFYLVDGPSHWRVIPSMSYLENQQMDWRVLHPECVSELVDFGFVEKVGSPNWPLGSFYRPTVCEVTERGAKLARQLRTSC